MTLDAEPPGLPPASTAALRTAFETRLAELLQHESLGVFILVLANANFRQATFERLRAPLRGAFERWCACFDRQAPAALAAAPDDIAVFRRLRDFGFDRLAATRWRRIGPWEVQFNRLREFRPARLSEAAVDRRRPRFDPDRFHFNKAFLRPEVFWEGELGGAPLRLLYNKFPFAELHGLLVLEPKACRAQYLDPDAHAAIWEITRRLGQTVPDIGFAYNALGAFASVNHLHFQMFVRAVGHYPIEAGCWSHNGGELPYPLTVWRYDDCLEAWQGLAALDAEGTTYNLLYRPGIVYLVPRAPQGSYRHAAWTGGFAWSEVCGSFTTSDEADFERLDQRRLEDELAKLALRP